ncbi:MAG: hypothetical protein ACRD4B_04780, partial [Acidobacteriota bacterium]
MQTPSTDNNRLRAEAEETLFSPDETTVCETYVFEPSPGEEGCGFLFIAGETTNEGGIGRELLDTIATAIQKEYYRDPKRSSATSFEMALHQANLILHDTVEQGIQDWMNYFHMAVAALSGTALHIAASGEARVLLVRQTKLTVVSEGLSHFPITNPLQTFSQVASGTVASSDMVFLATSQLLSLFRPAEISRTVVSTAAASTS